MASEKPTENNPTQDTNRESDVQASHSIPNIPPTPSVPCLPPAHPHCEITCKTEKNWWDDWKPFVEIGGVVLLGIYTGFTILMYCANKKAADAAYSSAQTADSTLKEIRLENRPWIVVKSGSVVSIKPSEQVQTVITFSNFGHTPGLETKLVARLHFTNDPNADVPEVGSPEDSLTSAIVAPTMELSIALRSIDKLDQATAEFAKRPDVRYYMYGIGTYRDTTTERILHHLEFCVFARYGILGLTPCTGKRYKNTTD